MLGISRRHSHFVFGIIQSGLTSAIASGIASFPFSSPEAFLCRWLSSWVLAWVAMLPIVIFAAPLIRRLTVALTVDDGF
jgi:Protein of unknown function (DUF2798)